MSNYTIVPMKTDSEIDGKGYVHWKSWHEAYSGLIPPEYMKTVTLEECVKIAHRWPENLLVAKDGEKVVGFVGCGPCHDPPATDMGEIFSIYVLAEYYGKQVGYELMNAAFELLSAYKKIAVWVLRGNERAIGFYKKYGFRFDGEAQEIMLGTPNTQLRMVYKRN